MLVCHSPFIAIFAILVIALTGCGESQGTFALPEGNAESGEATFILIGCIQCHSVGEIAWEGVSSKNTIHVPLGGKVGKVKSYSELVTSIINPSHKVDKKYLQEPYTNAAGQSNMVKYNDFMTVQDLVDIVTFLQGEYQLDRPRDIDYYPNW